MKALIIALLINFLYLEVFQLITANENDVQFDFNKYFKVNVATNKPTIFEKAVTLYNPHVWPGPNDTVATTPSTTTTTSSRRPRDRFVFGLRRSSAEIRNKGYGYDNNITQLVLNSSLIEPTISPINRKFYDLDFDHIKSNSNLRPRNISRTYRNFAGFRNISRHNITRSFPNFTRAPYVIPYQDLSRNFSALRNLTRNLNVLPIVNRTLNTLFRCEQMRYFGYYADIEAKCKIFWICTPDGRQSSFVCPDSLLFNQKLTVCDWSYNVDCQHSMQFYETNILKFENWNKQGFR